MITADNAEAYLRGIDLPVGAGLPVPPGEFPQRGGPKHASEYSACTTCGLAGHKGHRHVDMVLGGRIKFVESHSQAMIAGMARMSPYEVWWQVSVYPRMLRGYLDAYVRGSPITLGEVNAVATAYRLLCPDGLPPVPPPAPVKTVRRFTKFVRDLKLHAADHVPVHTGESEILALDAGVIYTPAYMDEVASRLPAHYVKRLRDLRHRITCMHGGHGVQWKLQCECPRLDPVVWMADWVNIGGGASCRRCHLLGHNQHTCGRLSWATRIIMNVTVAVVDRMDERVRAAAIRNSWMGLVRLLFSGIHKHDIETDDRIKERGLTSHDVVMMYNAALRGVSTRVVSLEDLSSIMVGGIGACGRVSKKREVEEAVDSVRKFARVADEVKLPGREYVLQEWGVTTRVRDMAVGLTALSSRGLRERTREDVVSVLRSYYHRGFTEGRDAFNRQVDQFGLVVGELEWFEAYHAIDRSNG